MHMYMYLQTEIWHQFIEGPALLLEIFQVFENAVAKFKDFQELSKTLRQPCVNNC